MLERMRALKRIALLFVFTSVLTGVVIGRAVARESSVATVDENESVNVNYDDPNLSFTSSYVGDTAADCPKSLNTRDLRACLVRNGLASGGASLVDQALVLKETAKTTKPEAESTRSIR